MAKLIVDHSVRLRQSLAELTFRAGVLCQHIDELRDQTDVAIVFRTARCFTGSRKRYLKRDG